jgi:hypothetical protein
MANWRRPVLSFYDARITHNPIPGYVAVLNEFHSWPNGVGRNRRSGFRNCCCMRRDTSRITMRL